MERKNIRRNNAKQKNIKRNNTEQNDVENKNVRSWKVYAAWGSVVILLAVVVVVFVIAAGKGKQQEPVLGEEIKADAEEAAEVDKRVKALVIDTKEEETEEDAGEEQEGQEKTVDENTSARDTAGELTELEQQIQECIAPVRASGAQAAIYVESLTDGAYAFVSGGQMQSASLIKLYIAGCVFEQMDMVRGQEVYAGETDELLRLMITISDNDATNTLVRRLGQGDASAGMARVNQFCSSHGFAETHMGRLMLDFNSADDNYTSVSDCGRLLRAICRGGISGSNEIIGLMKQQERTGRIPAGVPSGIVTAHKTGELTDVENDVAIIYADAGTYILCVMMSGLSDTYAARGTITQVSSQVYQYMAAR